MITYLQNLQRALTASVKTSNLAGCYHTIRTVHRGEFRWAVFDTADGLVMHTYHAGESQDEDAPKVKGDFDGHVLGMGSGKDFRALLLADRQGQPAGRTVEAMQETATQLGLKVRAPEYCRAGELTKVQAKLSSCGGVLVVPDESGVVALLGRSNLYASIALVFAVAPPEEAPVSEESSDDAEEKQPVEEAPMPEESEAPKPKAIMSGKFNMPEHTYHSYIEALGYEVVSAEGTKKLADDIAMVVFPMRSRSTSLSRQAEEKGVATMTVTELKEKQRSARIRKGG